MTSITGDETLKQPLVFEDYFDMGEQDVQSPFIHPESRHWGAELTVKAAIVATVLLAAAFGLSFAPGWMPLSNFLLICVYFLAGIPSLIESIEDLSNFEINIDVLMTLAAFSSVLIGSSMEGGLLLVLFALSGSMEDAVTAKAKGSIGSLKKLSPTKATVINSNGTLSERALQDVTKGMSILVRSGQLVPLDGIVTDGISSVNLVHLTGESLPVTKKVGDSVPAGARNLEGVLTLEVTHTSSDSTLAKIIQLVTQAQDAKPRLQRWFDSLSRGYAITIILLSAFFAATLPYFVGIPFLGMEGSLYRALAFLIAASPCALIIAIPIAYLSAIGSCARHGILLKGGITLDALANCRVIAFDKTGTLTTGDLTCEGIESPTGTTEEEKKKALDIAYSLERNSTHPIAKAILSYGDQAKAQTVALTDFKTVAGYGVEALVGKQRVFLGKPDYVMDKLEPAVVDALNQQIEAIQMRGELIAILLLDNRPYIFRFQDTIRPLIQKGIEKLKQTDMRLIMLTGDHTQNAKRVAEEVGIPEYYAELKPEDKLNHVAEISKNYGLAMVGDGINDAPALARATVGICMGKVGSTAAIDAADIVLLQDNIERLGWLMQKAHSTKRVVIQNLILAGAAILVASIPALGGLVPLWLAVVMHEGGTVLVGLNGLRLLK